MDLLVYHKETVEQPDGELNVFKPDIIDIHPDLADSMLQGGEQIEGKDEALQAVIMATIFQKGLDPVEPENGVQWSESLIGEVSVPQLITELQEAVSAVSDTVDIAFNTVNVQGKDYLTYEVRAI